MIKRELGEFEQNPPEDEIRHPKKSKKRTKKQKQEKPKTVEAKFKKEIQQQEFSTFQEDGTSKAKPIGDLEERQMIDLTNQLIVKKKPKMVFVEPRKLKRGYGK